MATSRLLPLQKQSYADDVDWAFFRMQIFIKFKNRSINSIYIYIHIDISVNIVEPGFRPQRAMKTKQRAWIRSLCYISFLKNVMFKHAYLYLYN